MGEQLYNFLSVVCIVIVKGGYQTHHQIRPSGAQVFQCLTSGLQFDDIRYVQFLEELLQHVDIEAFRLAVLV